MFGWTQTLWGGRAHEDLWIPRVSARNEPYSGLHSDFFILFIFKILRCRQSLETPSSDFRETWKDGLRSFPGDDDSSQQPHQT